MDKDTRKLLEELKNSTGYIPVSDLAERFEEIDDYYNHSPWTLLQILSNINIIVPVNIDSTLEYKGYKAVVHYDAKDNIFVGDVLDIEDFLSFHGTSVDELKESFHQRINNYLVLCNKLKKG